VPFGVRPSTARVTVSETSFRVRFGPWRLETSMANVTGAELTGPYSILKTGGPPHVSFADRGISFATNGDRGVCVSFATPVQGIGPIGSLRHPAATVTVEECEALLVLLTAGR